MLLLGRVFCAPHHPSRHASNPAKQALQPPPARARAHASFPDFLPLIFVLSSLPAGQHRGPG